MGRAVIKQKKGELESNLSSISEWNITLRTQSRLLLPIVIRYIIIIVLLELLVTDVSRRYYNWIYLGLAVLDLIPAIIVHVQYLYSNWNTFLKIDRTNKTLNLTNGKSTLLKTFEEVDHLTLYSSYGRNTGWYSFGQYRFCKIILKDGAEITVTCLMNKNLEDLEEYLNILFEKKYSIVAFLKS
jgi:hypothetical protein